MTKLIIAFSRAAGTEPIVGWLAGHSHAREQSLMRNCPTISRIVTVFFTLSIYGIHSLMFGCMVGISVRS